MLQFVRKTREFDAAKPPPLPMLLEPLPASVFNVISMLRETVRHSKRKRERERRDIDCDEKKKAEGLTRSRRRWWLWPTRKKCRRRSRRDCPE